MLSRCACQRRCTAGAPSWRCQACSQVSQARRLQGGGAPRNLPARAPSSPAFSCRCSACFHSTPTPPIIAFPRGSEGGAGRPRTHCQRRAASGARRRQRWAAARPGGAATRGVWPARCAGWFFFALVHAALAMLHSGLVAAQPRSMTRAHAVPPIHTTAGGRAREEAPAGSFTARWLLPAGADVDTLAATFQEGVLRIRVARS